MLFIVTDNPFNVDFDSRDKIAKPTRRFRRAASTGRGRDQRLKDQKIGAIYTSPYTRALQTASIIAWESRAYPCRTACRRTRLYSCDIGFAAFLYGAIGLALICCVTGRRMVVAFHERHEDVVRRVSPFTQNGMRRKRRAMLRHHWISLRIDRLGLDNAEVAALT